MRTFVDLSTHIIKATLVRGTAFQKINKNNGFAIRGSDTLGSSFSAAHSCSLVKIYSRKPRGTLSPPREDPVSISYCCILKKLTSS